MQEDERRGEERREGARETGRDGSATGASLRQPRAGNYIFDVGISTLARLEFPSLPPSLPPSACLSASVSVSGNLHTPGGCPCDAPPSLLHPATSPADETHVASLSVSVFSDSHSLSLPPSLPPLPLATLAETSPVTCRCRGTARQHASRVCPSWHRAHHPRKACRIHSV